MGDFYNGNKLLSLKDLNGRDPELFFCVGNRTAGKTFFFKRYMLRRFVRRGEKFVLFVRYIDDIPNTAEGFFADVGPIAFPGHSLIQKPLLHGKAAQLFFDGNACGYVIALNDPERIKRNSALFADAARGFLDEFQSEVGKYVPDEIRKFNSIRISIARGGATGKHVRYFPVFLACNNVTMFNPYYDEFLIAPRLQKRTKYIRGRGWVLEQTFNIAAAEALKDAHKTLSAEEIAYAAENRYLLDSDDFVKDIPGNKYCVLGIRSSRRIFGAWVCNAGKILISKKYDPSCGVIIATREEDHIEGSYLMGPASYICKTLRTAYERGGVYFDSGSSRYAFVSSMSVK